VSEGRRTGRVLATLTAGAVIGVVEVVLAVSFAALVFGGYLEQFLPDGIGLYLVAASLTLAILAWRGGARGVVGSVQDAAAAVLAIVATNAALNAFGSSDRAFLTVVAATVVVTLLTSLTFLLLGTFRLGNFARFIPYPVVAGFLAGTGWLLFKGGLRVAAGIDLQLRTIGDFADPFTMVRWIPAFAFGVVLLVASRVVKRPLVVPVVLAIGVGLFAIGMLVTGSSIESARDGLWLLGPFEETRLWQPWTLRALTGADWSAVLGQAAGIATAVFVAVIACLFNVGGVELLLHTDLDSNEELRDAGWVNAASGLFGGIPG
jgi:sulfate permease, SulP family